MKFWMIRRVNKILSFFKSDWRLLCTLADGKIGFYRKAKIIKIFDEMIFPKPVSKNAVVKFRRYTRDGNSTKKN